MLLEVRRSLLLVRTGLKHGLGPLARKLLRLPQRHGGPAAALRRGLEEMGLTYLKFGQFLAMRMDILPLEVCQELGKLFEQVPPLAPGVVTRVVESELGARLPELFLSFDAEPLASASVAQVHRARTRGGEWVAVKVQRPGIEAILAADMRVLRGLAGLLVALRVSGARALQDALDEFAAFTRREMNFIAEGRTAAFLRASSPHAVIPWIDWKLTTARVLTMELLEGVSLYRITRLLDEGREDELRALLPGLDVGRVLHDLTFALLHQIFGLGFFHGDPHPGNLMVLADNRVAFVDFGISGSLTRGQRYLFARYFESLGGGKIEAAFRYYAKLFTPSAETDLAAFERDQKQILERWYRATKDPQAPPRDRNLGKLTMDEIEVLRRHRIQMGMDTLLFWRAIFSLDSTGSRLSPDFLLLDELYAYFSQTRDEGAPGETGGEAAWRAAAAGMAALRPPRLRQLLLPWAEPEGERREATGLTRWVAAALLVTSVLLWAARLSAAGAWPGAWR